MNPRSTCCVLALAVALWFAGCAAKRPVLYPNPHLREIGPEQAERDIDACFQYAADSGVGSRRGRQVATRSATGAATGAAAGAAGGAVWGRAGRGAATGAAAAGAGSLMRGLFRSRDPDPIQMRFVEVCLRDLGYQPIGWR